ncbi:glycoside hydrolase [Niabella sp. W65]|nr:glycoside hydrolase [Niabella sp. W65]MCH7365372.1 glycoside hydrolase [Niabella sp. W65]ULT41163.1 glycoside hydrolase [Niabella sp. I65]
MIQVSGNNGSYWYPPLLVAEGKVNYSDIAVLKDGSVLILYGRGNPKEVVACRLSENWIRNHLPGNKNNHRFNIFQIISLFKYINKQGGRPL